MKKLAELFVVFIVAGVTAVVMNLTAQDRNIPAVLPAAPPAALTPEDKPTDPLARTAVCPKCGKTVRVSGREPHDEIACDCGAGLTVAEGEGHSLHADVVEAEPVVRLVPAEPKAPEPAGPPPEIEWRTDLSAAKAEAVRTGKSLLVIQTKTVGCAPCEELKRHVFTDPRVVEYVNEHCVACLVVDRQIFAGERFPFPAMWLRTPAGGGVLWRGARFKGDSSYPIPKEPEAFIAAIQKAGAA